MLRLSTAAVFLVSGLVVAAQSSPDLVSVWNQRVDPATHPAANTRSVKPVTLEDLKGEFPVPILGYVGTIPQTSGAFDINIEGYKAF